MLLYSTFRQLLLPKCWPNVGKWIHYKIVRENGRWNCFRRSKSVAANYVWKKSSTMKKTSCSYWQNRQDFLDKIKVRPRIVSPRFGKMIEVQLVQKKTTHKIRCRDWRTPQHFLYYLTQLAFRNIDEENLEPKVSG